MKRNTLAKKSKAVRFAIPFCLRVLNFLGQPYDKQYARNLWDKNV